MTPTVNPYRRVIGAAVSAIPAMVDRLRWDLDPLSWSSRRRIRQWQDRFTGARAVILCNGPSLNQIDFSTLSDCFTFGLNKINLLFSRSEFRPSCIVADNQFVLEQNADFYNTTSIPLFLDAKGRDLVRPRDGVNFLHSVFDSKFARDCSFSVSQGATVTYVALQLAFHMGFRRVALVGCDHSFASKGPANATVQSGAVDHSHFDPSYFAGGVPWQLPDLLSSEVAYTEAGRVFLQFGGEIVNCTVGGQLKIFRRQNLAEFLSEP